MGPQKFTASNTAEALKMVKAKLGPDAMVLSTQDTADGVEITAITPEDLSKLSNLNTSDDDQQNNRHANAELAVRKILERGALPDVTQLAPNGTALDTALDVLMASAHTLGLLLLPPAVRAGQRRYLERRLGRIAARESPVRCPPAAVQRSSAWLPEHMICAAVPPEDALRFAVGTHSEDLTLALARRLRVPPAALPDARLHARFVMAARPVGTAASAAGPITPKASSVGAALSAAAVAASSWRVRAVVGKVDQGAMEGVVEEMRAIRGRQGAGGRQGADPTRASTRKPEKHDEL
jgi:hypothetical protein